MKPVPHSGDTFSISRPLINPRQERYWLTAPSTLPPCTLRTGAAIDRYNPISRYPTCNSVMKCAGCAGSASSFWRRWAMCTRR